MFEKKNPIKEGEFDEDGALHISGMSAFVAAAKGAPLEGSEDAPEVRRAHITCPRCASTNVADAEVCWNCDAVL